MSSNAPPNVLLVDQDGVLADFDARYFELIRERFPHLDDPSTLPRRTDKLYDEYPGEVRQDLRQLVREPGFYESLPVIDGAVEAFERLRDAGWEMVVCTSPLRDTPGSVAEKLTWIERVLGEQARQQTLVTRDKTLARGRYLIDDRPRIAGLLEPTWRHLRYDSPIEGGPEPTIRWAEEDTWTWLLDPAAAG